MLKNLWLDEGGAVLSFELMLLLVIVVIGVSVGMVILRDAVVSEFQCVAAAINTLNPGYMIADLQYTGTSSTASVDGTDASLATLGIAAGTGQIVDSVVGSGVVAAASETSIPVPVVSP